MPLYRICKLSFSAAVHFGSDDGGSMLTQVREAFRADVLFSALYLTLLKAGGAEDLLSEVQSGRLWFSDSMPFCKDRLFLPKPIGQWSAARTDADPAARKKFKRLTWIPLEQLKPFLRGQANPDRLPCAFGETFVQTRVTLRTDDQLPLPYDVGGYRFLEDCGLYIVVRADRRETFDRFERALQLLGMEGIGGKVSSGWGKFSCKSNAAPEALQALLEDDRAPCQLLLSSAMPEEASVDRALREGRYLLVRRGGYAFSERVAPVKKRTVYLLAAGSAFPARFAGRMEDVGLNMPHPVWRCAMAGFAGVRL